MSNRHIQLADAVKNAINDAALGFTAVRKWRPKTERDDLATGTIQVVPTGFASTMADRSKMREEYSVDVALQREVDPDDNDAVDALHDKLHDIRALFEGQRITGLTVAVWQRTEMVAGAEAGFAPEHLEMLRVFTGVLRFVFLVIE